MEQFALGAAWAVAVATLPCPVGGRLTIVTVSGGAGFGLRGRGAGADGGVGAGSLGATVAAQRGQGGRRWTSRSSRRYGRTACAWRWPGSWTRTPPRMLAALLTAVTEDPRLIVDLSAVTFMDSQGLAALLRPKEPRTPRRRTPPGRCLAVGAEAAPAHSDSGPRRPPARRCGGGGPAGRPGGSGTRSGPRTAIPSAPPARRSRR